MFKKRIFSFAIAAFIFTQCEGSAPAVQVSIVEEPAKPVRSYPIMDETRINLFRQKCSGTGVEKTLLCTVAYSFNPGTKEGCIDELATVSKQRNKGYATRMLQSALIELSGLKVKNIKWYAEPDDSTDKKALEELERFYKKQGGIKIAIRNNGEYLNTEFAYPLQLARALSVLRPIFFEQDRSPKLDYMPQNDTWKIIVSYLRPQDFGYKRKRRGRYKLMKPKLIGASNPK